jgi:small conductance mechanosensitive channel
MNLLLLAFQDSGDEGDDTIEVDVSCDSQGPLCEALVEWTGNEALGEFLAYVIGAPIKIALIVVLALVTNRFLRSAVDRLTARLGDVTADHGDAVVSDRTTDRAEERAETIQSLLHSLTTAIIGAIALVMSLEVLGLSVVSVIASAGVLGLAIGFGAQSVVEDLLRGLFMLGEDQFGVGDRIDVGVVNGTVERITARTVVIRDPQGTIWHVPNSEVDYVANEAQLKSRAAVVIGVSYTTDLDEAFDVLERAAGEAADDPDWQDSIHEDPQVQSVFELGDDAVNLRVITWVDAGKRRAYERHLRYVLKEAIDEAGIELPNRQLDVWVRGEVDAA